MMRVGSTCLSARPHELGDRARSAERAATRTDAAHREARQRERSQSTEYMPARSAMSSPNHFACSWEFEWHPIHAIKATK